MYTLYNSIHSTCITQYNILCITYIYYTLYICVHNFYRFVIHYYTCFHTSHMFPFLWLVISLLNKNF